MAKRSTKKNRCSYYVVVLDRGREKGVTKRFTTLRTALKAAKSKSRAGRKAFIRQRCSGRSGAKATVKRLATCTKGACTMHPGAKRVKSHDWRKKGRMKVRRR